MELSFEIKYIMSAKNFTKEQAEDFLRCYVNTSEDMALDVFIDKTGGISPIISRDILDNCKR